MMNNFIDTAKMDVAAGTGGAGSRAMRREKYVPMGGPDGGDGGRGGDVVMRARGGMRTLRELSRAALVRADNGANGAKRSMDGRGGKSREILVPLGTLVWDNDSGELLGDLVDENQELVVARGGRGGRGNRHFVTPTKQAPKLAEKGEPGQERTLRMELKLLADIGLIGKPNAGKSTLLSAISAAKAKAGDYAFTTIQPQLGVVAVGDERQFVMADMPGLIEGAAQGKGLGHKFLRHMERTRVLLYLVDAASVDGSEPWKDYKALKTELHLYRKDFARLPVVIALNKMDLPEAREAAASIRGKLKDEDCPVLEISGASHEGLQAMKEALWEALQTAPPPPAARRGVGRRKVYRPAARFHLEEQDNCWILSGEEITKWLAMTDFGNEEAIKKLDDILKRLGVTRALKKAGAKEGDMVRVGKMEFNYIPDGQRDDDED